MNAAIEALNRAADAWWPQVMHATWQASSVAVILLLLVALGRRWSAQLRYGIVLIALLKFAIPPMLAMPTGLFSRVGPAVAPEAHAAALEGREAPAGLHAATAESPCRVSGGLSWRAALLLLHALGSVVAVAWILAQLARVTHMSRRAGVLASLPLREHAARLARKLRLRRRVRLLVLPEPAPPMAFGLLRPAVMMPASALRDLPPHQMKAVLAHELAHHRRGDLWVNWFQIALAVVWWFNPVFWLLSRVVRKTREDCCDDLLLSRRLTTGRGYCQALLDVASGLDRSVGVGGALGFAERLHPLGERMKRIMDGRLRRSPRSLVLNVSLLAVLAGLLLPGLRSVPAAVTGNAVEAPLAATAEAGTAGQGQAAPHVILDQVSRDSARSAPQTPNVGTPHLAALPAGTLVYSAAGADGWRRPDYPWAHDPIGSYRLAQAVLPEMAPSVGWVGAGQAYHQRHMVPARRPPPVRLPGREAWPALGSIGPLGDAGTDLVTDSGVNTQWQLEQRPTSLAWRLDVDALDDMGWLGEFLPGVGPSPGGRSSPLRFGSPHEPSNSLFFPEPDPLALHGACITNDFEIADILQTQSDPVTKDIPAFVVFLPGDLIGWKSAPVPEPASAWLLALGGLALLRRAPACRRWAGRRRA